MKAWLFIIKRSIEAIIFLVLGFGLYELTRTIPGFFQSISELAQGRDPVKSVIGFIISIGLMVVLIIFDSFPFLFPLLTIRFVIGKTQRPELKRFISIWSLAFMFIWVVIFFFFMLNLGDLLETTQEEWGFVRPVLAFTTLCGIIFFIWFVGTFFPFRTHYRANNPAKSAPPEQKQT